MRVVLGITLGLILAGSALADTAWTYSGNTMNGYVFSEENFGADFTDGTRTLINPNSTATFNPFEQSSTPFATWFVSLSGGSTQSFSQFAGSAGEATDFSVVNGEGFGYKEGNHGTWSMDPVGAAEPATGLFVGIGLAVVGLMRRRRKKPFQNTVWENLG